MNKKRIEKKLERAKKHVPGAVAVFLCVVSLAAFPLTYLRLRTEASDFDDLCRLAEELYSKEIYADAAECYLEMIQSDSDNAEYMYRLCECYQKNGDESEFISAVSAALELNPADKRGYILLCDWYYERGKYSLAYAAIEDAAAHGCTDTDLDEKKQAMDSLLVKKFVSAGEIYEWHGTAGTSYAVYERNGLYGIIRADGNISLNASLVSLGSYDGDSGLIPAIENGVVCFVDTSGKRKLVPDETYDWAGGFSDGYAPVKCDGEYVYVNKSLKVCSLTFDYAGAFCNGISAVMKDGKWALLNTDFVSITPFVYEEIKLDTCSHCSEFGAVCIRTSDGWQLSDLKGNICVRIFEDLALPASDDGFIAFKENGKWGFCDRDGNTVIDPQFEEAKSFSCGLAPVKGTDGWYFINTAGEAINDDFYDCAGTFSTSGRAFVRKNGCSFLLVISRFI